MKATGIVRRIDELGRIVVPKEIRRILRITEGDPLEIFTDRDGQIVLKKYSSINELSDFAKACADSLHQHTGNITCIVDKDHVVAITGGSKKDFYDKRISVELERAIIKRMDPMSANRKDEAFIPVLEDEEAVEGLYSYQAIAPVICQGDAYGAVIFLSSDKKMSAVDMVMAKTAAELLGKHASFGLL